MGFDKDDDVPFFFLFLLSCEEAANHGDGAKAGDSGGGYPLSATGHAT